MLWHLTHLAPLLKVCSMTQYLQHWKFYQVWDNIYSEIMTYHQSGAVHQQFEFLMQLHCPEKFDKQFSC